MGISFNNVTLEDLKQLPAPKSLGPMHEPLPLDQLVSKVDRGLETMGIHVKSKRLELSHENHRVFGTYHLATPKNLSNLEEKFGGMTPMLGLRGSTDCFTSSRVCEGKRVFVCSNGVWYVEHSGNEVKHKNTSGASESLDHQIRECLLGYWDRYAGKLDQQSALQDISLDDKDAHHLICESIRSGVQTGQHAAESLTQWHKPSRDWGGKSAWRLNNAMSWVSERKITNPHTKLQRTLKLDKMFTDMISAN